MVIPLDVSKMIRILLKFFWLYVSYLCLHKGYGHIIEHKSSARWISEHNFETSPFDYYLVGFPYVVIGFYIFIFVLKSFFNKK